MTNYTNTDPSHVHSDEYNRLWKLARANGWQIPLTNTFPDHVWIKYWTDVERLERDKQRGHPVPPHRSA